MVCSCSKCHLSIGIKFFNCMACGDTFRGKVQYTFVGIQVDALFMTVDFLLKCDMGVFYKSSSFFIVCQMYVTDKRLFL